jgi:hypothetical protein
MFKEGLKIEAVQGENAFKLTAPFVYTTYNGYIVTVPKGFKTNFASVPRLAKFYVDDNDWQIREPSVIHDFLYSADSKSLGYDRKEADGILFEAMVGLGMRRSKAALIYYILRMFGGSNYEQR